MLNEVSPQKLEPVEAPAEEHSVVLLSLLEALDSLGSNAFDLLPSNHKLLVFLQSQLPLSSKLRSWWLSDLSLVLNCLPPRSSHGTA